MTELDKMEKKLKEALKIIQDQNAKIERFAKMETEIEDLKQKNHILIKDLATKNELIKKFKNHFQTVLENLKAQRKLVVEQRAELKPETSKKELLKARNADEGIKMLKHKPNIAKDVKTKLHESAKNGCLEEARVLLQNGARFC